MDIWSTTLNPRPASFQILVVDCSIDICRGGGLLKKAAYQGANYILSSLQEMEGKKKKMKISSLGLILTIQEIITYLQRTIAVKSKITPKPHCSGLILNQV